MLILEIYKSRQCFAKSYSIHLWGSVIKLTQGHYKALIEFLQIVNEVARDLTSWIPFISAGPDIWTTRCSILIVSIAKQWYLLYNNHWSAKIAIFHCYNNPSNDLVFCMTTQWTHGITGGWLQHTQAGCCIKVRCCCLSMLIV